MAEFDREATTTKASACMASSTLTSRARPQVNRRARRTSTVARRRMSTEQRATAVAEQITTTEATRGKQKLDELWV
jgi:hypothetical protein